MNDTPKKKGSAKRSGEQSNGTSLLLIAGPTASGKSGLAVHAAKMLLQKGGSPVIINADASQVYSDLEIISARPSADEMQNVPHLLYGYRRGDDVCSAANWANDATQAINNAVQAGQSPIIVGGTGMYIKTLLYGIAPVPDIDHAVRDEVRKMEQKAAYRALQQHDPAMAERLNPNDRTRVQRALEVMLDTGKSIAFWRSRHVGGIAERFQLYPLILLPDRDWLYARCDRRFVDMVENGGLDEVQQLIARKYACDLPIMRAIGVKEIADYIAGHISHADMIETGQMATRRYAKRQYTWMRNQPPPNWPRITDINDEWEPKQHFANWLDSYN